MEIQNLKTVLQKIPDDIRLEAVGENTDIYLNLFPIIFSSPEKKIRVFNKVGNDLLNEYGERVDCYIHYEPNDLLAKVTDDNTILRIGKRFGKWTKITDIPNPNVIFQDLKSGHLEKVCDEPKYKIVRTTENQYELSEIKIEKSPTLVLEYLSSQNVRFF
jgi:hypothetical protein